MAEHVELIASIKVSSFVQPMISKMEFVAIALMKCVVKEHLPFALSI